MPTTIGELTNVPVPGDPIRSQIVQDLSSRVNQRFASLAALKSQWTAPPDGAFAYLLDENSQCVAKGGTWRWWTKMFANANGNTVYLTWAAGLTVATSSSNLVIVGRSALLWVNGVMTTPATAGNFAACTLTAAYAPATTVGNGLIVGYAIGAGSGRSTCNAGGSVTFTFSAADNGTAPTGLSVLHSYQLPDLVPA